MRKCHQQHQQQTKSSRHTAQKAVDSLQKNSNLFLADLRMLAAREPKKFEKTANAAGP